VLHRTRLPLRVDLALVGPKPLMILRNDTAVPTVAGVRSQRGSGFHQTEGGRDGAHHG
jgi:hypothetical protein